MLHLLLYLSRTSNTLLRERFPHFIATDPSEQAVKAKGGRNGEMPLPGRYRASNHVYQLSRGQRVNQLIERTEN